MVLRWELGLDISGLKSVEAVNYPQRYREKPDAARFGSGAFAPHLTIRAVTPRCPSGHRIVARPRLPGTATSRTLQRHAPPKWRT